MKTGIVVNNFDPTFKNKCQIRIHGLHTEKIDGEYVILDDDLPWAIPAPTTSATGSSSVPAVGSVVYVDDTDKYRLVYYGQVEVKGSVKKMMHDNAESSDRIKVIAFSEDQVDGELSTFKMYYLPEKGFVINCNGHKIVLTNYEGIHITSKNGAKIEIENDNTINVISQKAINLNCDKINLSENASESIILSSKLIEKFNNHTHLCPFGATLTPVPNCKLGPDDLSEKVKIN